MALSFYDLLQGPERVTDDTGSYTYGVTEGPTTIQATPSVDATSPITSGQAAVPDWLRSLYDIAKSKQASARSGGSPSLMGAGGSAVAPLPAPLQPVASEAGSAKGLISNSRQGIDIGTVIKLASLVYGGGMGGAMGGEAAAGAGAAGGSSSFLSGLMGGAGGGGGSSPFGGSGAASKGSGGLGGLLGGYQGKGRGPQAQLPSAQVNTSPLIPRTNDYWRPDAPNSLFG